MLRSLGGKCWNRVVRCFTGSDMDYDPDPAEIGYNKVTESTFITALGKVTWLAWLVLMLIPVISVYQPFGFTMPIDNNSLFILCCGLFLLLFKGSSVAKHSRRTCPACECDMEFYPRVERSTYKYVCHRCRVYIDTRVANYSDP